MIVTLQTQGLDLPFSIKIGGEYCTLIKQTIQKLQEINEEIVIDTKQGVSVQLQ